MGQPVSQETYRVEAITSVAKQTVYKPVPLKEHQIQAAGELLARAHFDDPGSRYIIPEDEARARLSPKLFTASVRFGYLYGLCHTTAGSMVGATMWLPPGRTDRPLWKMIRSGLFSAYLRVGINRVRRGLNYIHSTEEWHRRFAPEPHWYLFLIGVEPRLQGQGIGSVLLRPVLARADEQHLPCYLETGNGRNVAFYEKHDFAVVYEADIPKGGPDIWCMLRKPH
jgi:ribosomal protein S18 acetylase RimI-like enzyme